MTIAFSAESTGVGVAQYGARTKVPQANPKVRVLYGRLNFDNSYPSGGYPVNNTEAIAKSTFGLNTVLMVIPGPAVVTASGALSANTPTWSRATGKLMLFVTATGVETAVANQSANSCDAIVVGY